MAAAAVIALTVSAGFWQLRRADEKARLANARATAAALAPIDLGLGDPKEAISQALAQGAGSRRGLARGHWVPDSTILLDNRTHNGVAGFHVISAMRLEPSGAVVAVLRGWIARDPIDRNRLPPVTTATGEVGVDGPLESELPQALQLGEDPVPGPGDRVWLYFSIPKYRQWTGLPVQSAVIRQTSDSSDNLVRDWVQPGADVAKHEGYAFQWFAMALATVIWFGWWALKRRGRGAGT